MVSIQNSPINHDANQLKLSKRTKYIYLDLETKYFIYLSLFLWVFWRNTTNGSSYRFKRYFYFWNLNFSQWIMFSYFLIWLLMLHWWSGLQFDANAFWILCSGIKFGIFLCFEIGLGVILLVLPVKSGLLEYVMGTWISSKIFQKSKTWLFSLL